MINKKLFLTAFIFISLLTLSFSDEVFSIKKVDSDDNNNIIYQTNHCLLIIRKDYLTEDEINEFAKNVEIGINDITQYLTLKYLKYDLSKNLIKIEIRNGLTSQYRNGILYLPNVKEKSSAYLHELVHILAGYNDLGWLSIGLPVYLNDKFSKHEGFPNYKRDLDKLSKYYLSSNGALDYLDFDKVQYYLPPKTFEIKKAQMIFSGSMIKYIENKYGKEALLKLFNSNDFNGVLNISYDDLKKDWINYIKGL